MSRILRAAVTETVNAFDAMPARVEDLDQLAGRLDELRDANLAHHLELIAAAAAAGARVVGLGELFSAPYFALERRELWFALAEDALGGPTVSAMRAAARRHGMILVCPIYELCSASGKRFNTAVVIDAAGEVLGKYRKAHVPAGRNEAGAFCETFYYERSDGVLGPSRNNLSSNPCFPVFETALGRIAVAICYDRHFPGVMDTLAREGAELVFSPAVTFGAKSRRLWPLEFQVDAARHNVFIAGSNRCGTESPWNQDYFGLSHFVGPNGPLDVLPSVPDLVVSDLNMDELSAGDRGGRNLREDRREDIYS